MAHIRITNVVFEQISSLFLSPIHIAISFEVMEDLTEDIDWKLIYVGSSQNSAYDQILDSFSMPPIKKGIMQFRMESNPPDPALLPRSEILGASAIIISSSYKRQEYIRIGYFIFNTYMDEASILCEPQQVFVENIYRIIQADNPRIIRFDIDWKREDYSKLIQQVHTNQQFMFPGQNGLQGNLPGQTFHIQQGLMMQQQIPQMIQAQQYNQQMNPHQFGMNFNPLSMSPQQIINPMNPINMMNQMNAMNQGNQQNVYGQQGKLGMM